MRGIRTALVVSLVFLFALAAAQPTAAINVSITGSPPHLFVNGGPFSESPVTMYVEHFSDCCRNGIRVRERGLVAPETEFFTDDPECVKNVFFNDVVCTPFPSDGEVVGSRRADVIDIGGSNADCVSSSGTPFEVFLFGGDDQLSARFACGGQATSSGTNRLHPKFLQVFGFSGDDILVGGRQDDVISGDEGDDEVAGLGGADTLKGGFDFDDLRGGTGNDTLDGGSHPDTLDGGRGTDTLDGGRGTPDEDTASYATRDASVNVTLDGVANDGVTGEADTLIDIESITGSGFSDRLTGDAGENGLRGLDGNDTLEGGDGDDLLDGGGGTDVLRGQADDDEINSRDGVGETVNCGTGIDHAEVDLEDTFVFTGTKPNAVNTCESFDRFAVDDGPPGRIRGHSVLVRRSGRLKLRLRCPRRARVTCRGKLRLTDAGRSRRTLASKRYKVRRGRTKTLRLKLSRRAARRARGRRVIVVRTRERGVSRKGPRSTVRLLRVRRTRR